MLSDILGSSATVHRRASACCGVHHPRTSSVCGASSVHGASARAAVDEHREYLAPGGRALDKQVKQDWILDNARTNEDIGFLYCRLSVHPFFFADVLSVFLTLSGCDVLVASFHLVCHGARDVRASVASVGNTP